MSDPPRRAKPFPFSALVRPAACQQEMLRFVLVSTLDVFMTYVLLRQPGGQFVESNPIARFFIYGWGVKGMVGFKLSMTALVCVISQIVAGPRPRVAKGLLNGATLVVAGVVVYSLVLMLKHADTGGLSGVLMEAVD
jgi:hypothetical protein